MYNSSDTISIHEVNKRLTFNKGVYYLDVIGGWKIERNGFSIKLVHENGEDIVYPVSSWPRQTMYSWKEGTRVFDFQIPKKGIYTVHFSLPKNLVVRPMRFQWFSFFGLFHKKVDNELITVVFYRQ